MLLHPFAPIVIAADENERIRYASIYLIEIASINFFPCVFAFGFLFYWLRPKIYS